ncbi:MAG: ribosome biogenesis GTPase YlqF [Fusobacteriota bacterium]
MEINWYPGHMKKTKNMIKENLKIVDLIFEIVDARVPLSSKNPDISKLTGGKKRILLLNKSDLVSSEELNKWKNHFIKNENIEDVIAISAKTGENLSSIFKAMKEVAKVKTEKMKKRGLRRVKVRVLIAGIPNVGKSHLINRLKGKKSAGVANTPGHTKGKQWIKLDKQLELLDTPGILWPKFESEVVGLHLAITGAIKDQILDISEITNELVKIIKQNDSIRGKFKKVYKLSDEDMVKPSYEIIEKVASNLQMLVTGGKLDIRKAEHQILREYRDEKFGKFILDQIGQKRK